MNEIAGSGSIIPDHPSVTGRPALLTRITRSIFLRQLELIRDGQIVLCDGSGTMNFGSRTARCALAATIEVRDERAFSEIVLGGSVGAGSAFIQGWWTCRDLTSLFRIFVANRDALNGLESRFSALRRVALGFFHRARRNNQPGARRNIAAHYDIGNDLYELMLDQSMAYSCAIFRSPDATLHQAQIDKFDTICRKLDLRPTDHLLEIGTGWGGLAIHAAQNFGCRVTTTTISRRQHDFARSAIDERGLQDRIELRQDDYRVLSGEYDKLVSVEMIEAVGHDYLDCYLAKCASLLKRNGAMLLQAITIQDQFYAQALRSVDFIQRYIFPGSFIPSIDAISQSLRRVTDFKIFHLEDIGPHYATTLRMWRERFFASIDRVRELGYPETFARMWEYYLCYCEGGFAERQLGDVQMLLTRPDCRREVIAAA
ncbi:MAG: cyclopropane-fatty-acyl-phospholipid synthase family protein [Steroidobacteraceae bacterium]